MVTKVDEQYRAAAATDLLLCESRALYGPEAKTFKRLRVYAEAVILCRLCYEFTGCLPKEEAYGLSSQLRRASVSVPANIAEGWGRDGNIEFARFIDIAMGSVCEIRALVDLCVELNYTSSEATQEIDARADALSGMLHNFRAKLRS